MNLQLIKAIAAMTVVLTFGSAHSQADVPPKAINPYFHKEGATIFVSGPLQYWSSGLWNSLWNPKSEGAWAKYKADPNLKVERVVFVNTTSLRPEVTGGEISVNVTMRDMKIDTVVVGRCDLFCSRYFAGGTNRYFAQDLPKGKSFIDIQVPVDYPTQKLEPRFPETQLAIYQRNIPNIGSFKEVMTEALTKGGWNGGLEVPADGDVRFCEDRVSEKGCKTYSGVSALSMGFITSAERMQIDIPKGFGDPIATRFAEINDAKAVPLRGDPEKFAASYQKFLASPLTYGRAFAISESQESGAFGWANGTNAAGNHAQRAINSCQEKAKSVCRLYAVDDKVVW